MNPFNWTCPYCGRHSTITSESYSRDFSEINVTSNSFISPVLLHEAISCPNSECQKLTLVAKLHRYGLPKGHSTGVMGIREKYEEWQLCPRSRAKPLPNYIPQPIAKDYAEACLICVDSPKASATLARRCLQGMIRDYWSLPKSKLGKLAGEINAIKDRMDPDTWDAIDAIRSVGNIGAHMEKDINVIVDVDSGEAELLIELIEMLFEDWYLQREKRRIRTQKAIDLAEQKKAERKQPPKDPDTSEAASDSEKADPDE